VNNRREIVLGGAAAATIKLATISSGTRAQVASPGKFEIVIKSDEEWRRELTSEQYAVLRRRETERPWTSPLNKEYRPGTYLCADQGTVVVDSVLMSAADRARL